MGGRNPAPKKPWNDDSPAHTNKPSGQAVRHGVGPTGLIRLQPTITEPKGQGLRELLVARNRLLLTQNEEPPSLESTLSELLGLVFVKVGPPCWVSLLVSLKKQENGVPTPKNDITSWLPPLLVLKVKPSFWPVATYQTGANQKQQCGSVSNLGSANKWPKPHVDFWASKGPL